MSNADCTRYGKIALIVYLLWFPEDVRDIRRLVARFRLSAREVGEALDATCRIAAQQVNPERESRR